METEHLHMYTIDYSTLLKLNVTFDEDCSGLPQLENNKSFLHTLYLKANKIISSIYSFLK